MDEFVARANIKHFQRLIESASDDARRKELEAMLADEHQKLAAALKKQKQA